MDGAAAAAAAARTEARAGARRNQPALGVKGTARRRQDAISIGRDKRDALLRAKRFRVSHEEDVGMKEEQLGIDDEAALRKAAETRIEAAVKELQEATSGPAKGSAQVKTSALRALRWQLSRETEPPVDAAVRAGVVPLLISCLGFGSPEEQLVDAAWCLSNIAGGSSKQAEAVLPASALLVAHLGERSPETVIDHCAWAISNLAAEGTEATAVLLKQGVLPALARILLVAAATRSKEGLAQTIAWALSNVLKASEPRIAVELVRTDFIPAALVSFLNSGNLQLAAEVAWVLVYITVKSDACTEQLLAAGVAVPLLRLLESSSEPVILTPVVRTIGNITAMDNSKTDALLAAGSTIPGGAFGAFTRCLESPHRTVQKEIAWALSNIAGGSREHKEAVFKSPVMTPLLQLFSSGAFDVRKEVAFALGNLCVAPLPPSAAASTIPEVNVQVLDQIVKGGCLPTFLSLVRSPDLGAARLGLQFVEMVLRVLPNGPKLVEVEDGIDAMESLQFHGNDELRVMASHLVDKYFGEEYGLEEEYGPGAGQLVQGSSSTDYPPWRMGASDTI